MSYAQRQAREAEMMRRIQAYGNMYRRQMNLHPIVRAAVLRGNRVGMKTLPICIGVALHGPEIP